MNRISCTCGDILGLRMVVVSIGMCLLGAPMASAAILFEDGFESGNLSRTTGGIHWADSVSAGVSNERAESGAYSLKFTFAGSGGDSFSEQRFSLGGHYPEVWIRYDIYIPTNYTHRQNSDSSNNKGYLSIWSGNYSSPNGPLLGLNFWPKGNSTGPASYASLHQFGMGLDQHAWSAMPNAIEPEDRGKWIRIVLRFKYASAANNDGIAEAWKTRDGQRQKIMSITNGAWYRSGQSAGFDQGYLLGWANSGFSETTVFYIDNFAISTDSLLSDLPVVPNPPTAVSAD